jgi:prepilin-type N-terminal cleavage/methylation domain-containing protein
VRLLSRKTAGFTMIELLVVIGILGILAAMIIAAINPRRQLANAKVAEATRETREIKKAIESYIIQRGTSGLALPFTIPSGSGSAIELCKYGQTGTCLSVDQLVTDLVLTDIPSHSAVATTSPGTGYKVYMNGAFIMTAYTSTVQVVLAMATNSSSTSFTPSSISGLQAWFDASNTASLTLSASNVTQWNDLSGNARHATQGSSGLQPLSGQLAQNGLNVVTCAAKYMDVGGTFQVQQVFTVFKSRDTTYFSNYGSPFGNKVGPTTNRVFMFENGNTISHSNPYPVGVWKNGTTLSFPYSLAPINNFMYVTYSAANPTVSRTYQLCAFEDVYVAPIDLAEVIAYSTVLSTADREAVEAYLAAKWGL